MKNSKILLILSLCCFAISVAIIFLASMAMAGTATFSWLPNSEPDIAGYKIHYGPATRDYVSVAECGLPETNENGRVECTVTDTPAENTFYAVTAYDTSGTESDFSNEVSDDAPPGPPGGFEYVSTTTTTTKTVTETTTKLAFN